MKSKEFNALIIDASTDNLYVMLLSQGEVLKKLRQHQKTQRNRYDGNRPRIEARRIEA